VRPTRARTRLLLGLPAAHATRKALSQTDVPRDESEVAERLRAHRLAVLLTLLNGFKALGPARRRRR
jgi:hypothetical protein